MRAVSTSRERLYLFDTTLRDGQQTPGVDFSLDDKLVIAGMLDDLGLDYIEGGYPGANPTDTALFAEERPMRAIFTAFGMVKRPGRSLANDAGFQDVLQGQGQGRLFRRQVVGLSRAPGARQRPTRRTCRRSGSRWRPPARRPGRRCVDCEHFFDGYKVQSRRMRSPAPGPPMRLARAGSCSATPTAGRCRRKSRSIVRDVAQTVPGTHLGIHAHDDTGQAVANSLAAVLAGVRHIQGTLNGIGERCGNANLVTIIPTLKIKDAFRDRFDIGVSDERLATLTHVSRAFDELLNRRPHTAGALCRSERLRHQGRHSCLGHPQGAGDLRACRARAGSAICAGCWSPTRRASPVSWPSSAGSASR